MKASIIKNPQAFSVEFPSFEEMVKAIENPKAEGLFIREINENEMSKFGFNSNQPIRIMDNGFRIGFSSISKKISALSIKQAFATKANAIESDTGESLNKSELETLREEIILEKLKTADVERVNFFAFFHEPSSRLIIDVTNDDLAKKAVGFLIKLLGSLKATTIYVDGIGESLSNQILKSIENGDELGFAGFEFGDKLHLKHVDLGSAKFSGEYTLDHIQELIGNGFECERVALKKAGMEFDFTSDLKVKSIKLTNDMENDILDDFEHIEEGELQQLKQQTVSLEMVSGIFTDLTEYFENLNKS